MRKTYAEKLQDPRWQKKRLEVLSRDSFTCQLCGDTETTLHVHHFEYEHGKNPWEYEKDRLTTYCKTCHRVVEELLKIKPEYVTILKAINIPYPNDIDRSIIYVVSWDSSINQKVVSFFEFDYELNDATYKLSMREQSLVKTFNFFNDIKYDG